MMQAIISSMQPSIGGGNSPPTPRTRVVLLAGGTGGAQLAVGFQRVLTPGALTVVTNTADDVDMWGLRVCPDTDAVLFRLGGIFNDRLGFGVADDTTNVLEQLARLEEPTWFRLGDRDLAFHILRTSMLRRGLRLTEAIGVLGARLRVCTSVLPMSDGDVRTYFDTDAGRLGFQEYFVREQLRPGLRGIGFAGVERARPSPEVEAAMREADLIVVGPSNPLISIAPIAAVLEDLRRPERTVAVSPLIGGKALKGPTVEMLQTLRGGATPATVAREYRDLAAWFVLDEQDADDHADVEATGARVLVADTVMRDADGAERLARELLSSLSHG
jgi:LPPG:FO 2-phospho-L-lactate transferase